MAACLFFNSLLAIFRSRCRTLLFPFSSCGVNWFHEFPPTALHEILIRQPHAEFYGSISVLPTEPFGERVDTFGICEHYDATWWQKLSSVISHLSYSYSSNKAFRYLS